MRIRDFFSLPLLVPTLFFMAAPQLPNELPTGEVKGAVTQNPLHPLEEFYSSPFLHIRSDVIASLPTTVYPEDKIAFFPDPLLGIGARVQILRALAVTIKDGKTTVTARTWQATVGTLLDEQQIALGAEDKLSPAADLSLSQETTITITRVAKTTVTEREKIPFKTVTKKDAQESICSLRTAERGVNGERANSYLVVREDGELVSKTFLASSITRRPSSEIKIQGTKVKTYGRGKATWYLDTDSRIAAHNSLPRGTMVKLVNLANGRSEVVKIVGPGIYGDATIDTTTGVMRALGVANPHFTGVVQVELQEACG